MRQNAVGGLILPLISRVVVVLLSAIAQVVPTSTAGSPADGHAEPPVVPCGDMEVVLVIDTTGSMSRVIEDVKVEARALLDLIDRSSAGRFRLGLVTFDKRVAVHHDLDSRPSAAVKKAAVMASIQQLRADGGGSGPEASDEASIR